MLIKIKEDQSLSLEEEYNFKAFCIRTENPNTDLSPLEKITERIEDGNYWLNAQGVIDLSSKSENKEWLGQFWSMLKGAEPYGFADFKAQLIRAHIEYDVSE